MFSSIEHKFSTAKHKFSTAEDRFNSAEHNLLLGEQTINTHSALKYP